MDTQALTAISEERVYGALVSLEQSEVRERLRGLRDTQVHFLKIRAMASSDAEALHLLGHARDAGDTRACECGRAEGWLDARSQTILKWKKQDDFRFCYDLLLQQPLLFAAARMEALAPKAIATYEDLLGADQKASVRRAAARDVVESIGLKATPGVEGSGNAVRDSFAFRMALSRYQRQLEISSEQRALLQQGGIVLNAEPQQDGSFAVERTLDGEDIRVERGGDNSEFLPD